MADDRAHADSFHLTHEFLAYMLGVRRVDVTPAAGKLRRAGLIRYRGDEVRVLEREALDASSRSCYAADCRRLCRIALNPSVLLRTYTAAALRDKHSIAAVPRPGVPRCAIPTPLRSP